MRRSRTRRSSSCCDPSWSGSACECHSFLLVGLRGEESERPSLLGVTWGETWLAQREEARLMVLRTISLRQYEERYFHSSSHADPPRKVS